MDWTDFLVPEGERLPLPRFPRSILSYGPDELHLRETVIPGGGPDTFVENNPQLFATGTTSRDEGYFYWALTKVIGPERQVGRNGMIWYYQSKVDPAGRAGSAVVDFVIVGAMDGWDLGIRIVTIYRHTEAGPSVRAYDFEQQTFLLDNGIYPVDVDSEDYISDLTGRAAIAAAERAISVQPDLSSLY